MNFTDALSNGRKYPAQPNWEGRLINYLPSLEWHPKRVIFKLPLPLTCFWHVDKSFLYKRRRIPTSTSLLTNNLLITITSNEYSSEAFTHFEQRLSLWLWCWSINWWGFSPSSWEVGSNCIVRIILILLPSSNSNYNLGVFQIMKQRMSAFMRWF